MTQNPGWVSQEEGAPRPRGRRAPPSGALTSVCPSAAAEKAEVMEERPLASPLENSTKEMACDHLM